MSCHISSVKSPRTEHPFQITASHINALSMGEKAGGDSNLVCLTVLTIKSIHYNMMTLQQLQKSSDKLSFRILFLRDRLVHVVAKKAVMRTEDLRDLLCFR